MDDQAFKQTVRESPVYAYVNPEHKLRIVKALQNNGAVVAMTGDGVNNALALKTANSGIAMGMTGTDVSKETADMILVDDNLATIVNAVEEGHSVFANIQKFLRFRLSSNIGEVLTMFSSVVLADRSGLTATAGEAVVVPLLAPQILWVNLVTDGAPVLALGLDPADPDVMKQPSRVQGSGMITHNMWGDIVFVGVIMVAGTQLCGSAFGTAQRLRWGLFVVCWLVWVGPGDGVDYSAGCATLRREYLGIAPAARCGSRTWASTICGIDDCWLAGASGRLGLHGVVFAVLVRQVFKLTSDFGTFVLVGLLYGLLIWFVSFIAIIPLVNPKILETPWPNLGIGYPAFGVATGLLLTILHPVAYRWTDHVVASDSTDFTDYLSGNSCNLWIFFRLSGRCTSPASRRVRVVLSL